MLGKHLIKSWSSTQASISLSSGEADFYGVVKAPGVGLGFTSLLADVGVYLPLRVWTDSTATIGICGRQGLGKLRHVDTQCLWIQQRVRDNTLSLLKVRGEDNPADLFTKHLVGSDRVQKLLMLFGCTYQSGRAASAPTLRAGKGTGKGELLNANIMDPKKMEWADMEDVNITDTIEWTGFTFPKAKSSDGESTLDLPDAYPASALTLPHMHADLHAHFPRAIACPAKGDQDPEEDRSLEDVGWKVGIGVGGLEEGAREGTPRKETNDETTQREEGVGLLAGAGAVPVGAVLPVRSCVPSSSCASLAPLLRTCAALRVSEASVCLRQTSGDSDNLRQR